MKLRKLLLVGGIVGLGFAFISGTKYVSYAKQEVRALLDKAATPEREIERLREEIRGLDKVEKEMKDELANQIVQCDRLTKEIARQTTEVAKAESNANEFAELIKKSDKGFVALSNVKLSVDEAKRRLKSDVTALGQRKATVGSMEVTKLHREDAKKTIADQLNEIQSMKLALTNELDAIEAEYKALKLESMKNKYHRDDSKWSNIREGIEKLKEKVDYNRVRVGLDTGKGKIDGPVTETVDEILAPLTGKAGEKSGD
jgi:chromosome segregation ATPase